jgi:GTP-binding protein HflX
VLAEDKLFATLDPTARRLRLPHAGWVEGENGAGRWQAPREIIIADTVGFIRDLPRDLARAFRATLEELDEADLLLHVVDAADPAHEQQIAAVETILADLGLAETPRILVMNKIDLLPAEERARLGRGAGELPAVAVSAADPTTAPPLLAAMEAALWRRGVLDGPAREEEAPAP